VSKDPKRAVTIDKILKELEKQGRGSEFECRLRACTCRLCMRQRLFPSHVQSFLSA
jgi:hypothetical protein